MRFPREKCKLLLRCYYLIFTSNQINSEILPERLKAEGKRVKVLDIGHLPAATKLYCTVQG